ncbi:hypothetical protein B0A48_12391 [Cryoendolithus antarcticus]|uniref:STB6-like N-terminal domain-containing protein n=1 Tax=Cryoendolithus antarcticus TaxID=1507870 RepID=A0A1V8SSB8_9PEZI|nr:hypothetical protein B0A48_12391 [Cryoendolithus antarcticus]
MDDARSRPLPLQTASLARPTTAPHDGSPRSPVDSSATSGRDAVVKPGHQRFVLNDPVAFRYLEEDPSTTVLERRRELEGYESYIVEQWTTSRTHPTFVITTFTGDASHKIVVGVLSVPTEETAWSPRLRVYFKALNQYHARRRETPLGILMVTNLSAFPSSLSVIPVPDGDLKKHRFDFFVNENLKRLGCSGRMGLTLAMPAPATAAKFHQLYRTSDKNDIYKSVIELVKLCQSALMLFNKLDVDYADGLLCDVTERAINDWWVEMGSDYYSIEPHDGILGPTTVAALLGLLMGARNRLHSVGAPVSKDAFNVDAMKRGISTFQKQQRITRSRRLDRDTLSRLHRASAKAASSESWGVPKVVKSTMAELSGKGGEMVMDAVGRRDKAGLAEIETSDLERFVQLIYGEHCKWLWYGKPLRSTKLPMDVHPGRGGDGPGLEFKPDEHGGFTWTARKSTIDGMPNAPRPHHVDRTMTDIADGDTDEDEVHKGGLLKRASGLRHDAKSKIKGVVGIKSHQSKLSQGGSPRSPVEDAQTRHGRPILQRSLHSATSSIGSQDMRDPTLAMANSGEATRQSMEKDEHLASRRPATIEEASRPSEETTSGTLRAERDDDDTAEDRTDAGSDTMSTVPSRRDRPSITERDYHGVDLDEVLPAGADTAQSSGMAFRRTLSLSHFASVDGDITAPEHYPRHLSFSLAEDSLLTWDPVVRHDDAVSDDDDLALHMATHELDAKTALTYNEAINEMTTNTAPWTTSQIAKLREILPLANHNADKLAEMYAPHLESLKGLQQHTEVMLRGEREALEEGGKELEQLAAKLEYEINGLKDRVEDVETGVGEFERSVRRVEDRVTELEKDEGRRDRRCVVQ